MTYQSLEAFIPSGRDFDTSKELFLALGFTKQWDAGEYVGFANDGCRFILQRYDNQAFAENLMMNLKVSDVDAFWTMVTEQRIAETFGIKIIPPRMQPYGKEVVLIDLAGVCWHIVQ